MTGKAENFEAPPAVHFKYGTPDSTAINYRLPRGTMDPRWAACVSHHVACDCREAEFAETVAELKAEVNSLRRVVEALWAGAPVDVRRSIRSAALAEFESNSAAVYRRTLYLIADPESRLTREEVGRLAQNAVDSSADAGDVPF
ncbi:hypothetical protein [Frankia sp. Cj3]|uniref:hypothetical protein n=1 Tax=Frankia sp. Cj3 TaxID=2880976 RepID=UPI001EF6BF4B|nr:hypothetical protein [Frankia sp. Cj3]